MHALSTRKKPYTLPTLKLKWWLTVGEMEQICTQLHIGCTQGVHEYNTISCQYPGRSAQAPATTVL